MRLYRGDDLPSVWAGYFFGMHISTVIMVSAWSVVWYCRRRHGREGQVHYAPQVRGLLLRHRHGRGGHGHVCLRKRRTGILMPWHLIRRLVYWFVS